MNMKTTRYRKPNLMVLLTFFVGLGVVLTSVTQAAEPAKPAPHTNHPTEKQQSLPQQWLRALWDLDLTSKLQNWKPKIEVDTEGDGFNLSRPFGSHGPSLRLSTDVPEHAQYSLRAGGDKQFGSLSTDRPDAYLFLQKRW